MGILLQDRHKYQQVSMDMGMVKQAVMLRLSGTITAKAEDIVSAKAYGIEYAL